MAFPGTYNFDYYRGDTFRFVVSPKDSNGNALDLSSYLDEEDGRDAIFTIADARGASAISTYSSIVELEGNFPLSATIDVENSTITCTIKPDGGRYLEGGSTYYYDVEIYNGADLRYTLLTGAITVEDDVTGAE
jgi:hypothetical protein